MILLIHIFENQCYTNILIIIEKHNTREKIFEFSYENLQLSKKYVVLQKKKIKLICRKQLDKVTKKLHYF